MVVSQIRIMLDAICLLRKVRGCELELQSLGHKLQALYLADKEGLSGCDFIDACTDEELIAAIVNKDERLGDILNPFVFNYLRSSRHKCLVEADRIRLGS